LQTVDKMVTLLEANPVEIAPISAIMQQVFGRVEVDWPTGQLWFHWKHAPGETAGIMYAWPREE
jgi:hypothetical protein